MMNFYILVLFGMINLKATASRAAHIKIIVGLNNFIASTAEQHRKYKGKQQNNTYHLNVLDVNRDISMFESIASFQHVNCETVKYIA